MSIEDAAIAPKRALMDSAMFYPLLGKLTERTPLRFPSPEPIERISTATIDQRFSYQCICALLKAYRPSYAVGVSVADSIPIISCLKFDHVRRHPTGSNVCHTRGFSISRVLLFGAYQAQRDRNGTESAKKQNRRSAVLVAKRLNHAW